MSCYPTVYFSKCSGFPCSITDSQQCQKPWFRWNEFFQRTRQFKVIYFKILSHISHIGFVSFFKDSCVILSKAITGFIHIFSLHFTKHALDSDSGLMTMSYEEYYGIKRAFHPSLLNDLKYWSQLEELFRFVKNYSVDTEDFNIFFS